MKQELTDVLMVTDDGDSVDVRTWNQVFHVCRREGEPDDLVWHKLGRMMGMHLKKLSEERAL